MVNCLDKGRETFLYPVLPSHLEAGEAHLEASAWWPDVFAPATVHPGHVWCLNFTTLPLHSWVGICIAIFPFQVWTAQFTLYLCWMSSIVLWNKQEHQNLTKHRLIAFLSFPLPAGSWVFGPAVFMFPCSLLRFRRTLTTMHVWKLLRVTSCISVNSDKLINSSLFCQY